MSKKSWPNVYIKLTINFVLYFSVFWSTGRIRVDVLDCTGVMGCVRHTYQVTDTPTGDEGIVVVAVTYHHNDLALHACKLVWS